MMTATMKMRPTSTKNSYESAKCDLLQIFVFKNKFRDIERVWPLRFMSLTIIGVNMGLCFPKSFLKTFYSPLAVASGTTGLKMYIKIVNEMLQFPQEQ